MAAVFTMICERLSGLGKDSVVVGEKTRVIPTWVVLWFYIGSHLKCLHILAKSFCCLFCFLVPDADAFHAK